MPKLSDCYRLASPLYAFIRGLVRNREDADDVYQQTGQVLCEQFDRYDPLKPFIAWACGIAWQSVLLHRKNASRLRLLTHEEMDPCWPINLPLRLPKSICDLSVFESPLASLKAESRESSNDIISKRKE